MMANSKQTFCCIDINTFNIFNTVQKCDSRNLRLKIDIYI